MSDESQASASRSEWTASETPLGPGPAEREAMLSRELDDLNLLFQVVNLMHSTMDPEPIARITLTAMTAGTALGMNRAAILLSDVDDEVLRGYVAVGPNSLEEAGPIWDRLDRESLSLEDLVHRALGQADGLDRAFAARVAAVRLPLQGLVDGPVSRALDGEGATFGPEDPLPGPLQEIFGGPAGFVVPLRSVDRILGVVIADRFLSTARQATDRLPLAVEVAHQAGLALGNAQHFDEVRIRAAELATLHELGKKFLANLDLSQDAQALTRCACQVASARGSVIWVNDEDGAGLRVEARWSQGDLPPEPGLEAALAALALRALAAGRPLLLRDTRAEGVPEGLAPARSVVCVPLIAYGRSIGALAVYDRIARNTFETGGFSRHNVQFLYTLADQAAIALENLRLLERFRRSERQLRETQALLMHNEKLAALGEMSAKVAHEIRNPLASIGGFARRVSRTMAQNDPNREPVEIIVRETERLERILSEQLQFAQLSRPRLAMEDLNAVLGETLQLLGPSLLERRVRLIKRFGPDIPRLLLDADKIKQVMLNILQNALQNVSTGGRVKLETRRAPDSVHIDVANDGPKIPGEIMERLFVPFATSRPSGTGLGLAVADQIVREHGGEIRVRSDGDWGCVFTVTLPLERNQDRRAGPGDRRSGMRTDRRQH